MGSGAVSGVAGAAGGPGLLRACRPGWPLQAVGSGAVSGVAGAVGGCGPPRSRRRGWPLLAGWIRYCVRWVGAAGSSVQMQARRPGWPLLAVGSGTVSGVAGAVGGCGPPRSWRRGWPTPAGWIRHCVRWVGAAGSSVQLRAGALGGHCWRGDQVLHQLGRCSRWPRAVASRHPGGHSRRVIRNCIRRVCAPRVAGAASGPWTPRSQRSGWSLPVGWCRYWVRRVCAAGGLGSLRFRAEVTQRWRGDPALRLVGRSSRWPWAAGSPTTRVTTAGV